MTERAARQRSNEDVPGGVEVRHFGAAHYFEKIETGKSLELRYVDRRRVKHHAEETENPSRILSGKYSREENRRPEDDSPAAIQRTVYCSAWLKG
jgi:hypothetical protein